MQRRMISPSSCTRCGTLSHCAKEDEECAQDNIGAELKLYRKVIRARGDGGFSRCGPVCTHSGRNTANKLESRALKSILGDGA